MRPSQPHAKEKKSRKKIPKRKKEKKTSAAAAATTPVIDIAVASCWYNRTTQIHRCHGCRGRSTAHRCRRPLVAASVGGSGWGRAAAVAHVRPHLGPRPPPPLESALPRSSLSPRSLLSSRSSSSPGRRHRRIRVGGERLSPDPHGGGLLSPDPRGSGAGRLLRRPSRGGSGAGDDGGRWGRPIHARRPWL